MNIKLFKIHTHTQHIRCITHQSAIVNDKIYDETKPNGAANWPTRERDRDQEANNHERMNGRTRSVYFLVHSYFFGDLCLSLSLAPFLTHSHEKPVLRIPNQTTTKTHILTHNKYEKLIFKHINDIATWNKHKLCNSSRSTHANVSSCGFWVHFFRCAF